MGSHSVNYKQPIVVNFISFILEYHLDKHILQKTLPILSPEWILKFTFRMQIGTTGSGNCGLVGLSNGKGSNVYGHKTPVLAMRKETQTLVVNSALHGNPNAGYVSPAPFVVNETYHIQVRQRYIGQGEYRFFIVRNGEETYSTVHMKAEQFYDVKISTGECSCCYIKDFEVTNLL